MVHVDVSFSGPIFAGRYPGTVESIVEEAMSEVGARVTERVQYWLNSKIRRPTPYYETQITHQRSGRYEIVHDRGIIYGPWLEGTSTRNRTTKFKGYASFRRARQEAEQMAPEIINQVIRRNLGRLGA